MRVSVSPRCLVQCPGRVLRPLKLLLTILVVIFIMACLSGQGGDSNIDAEVSMTQVDRKLLVTPRSLLIRGRHGNRHGDADKPQDNNGRAEYGKLDKGNQNAQNSVLQENREQDAGDKGHGQHPSKTGVRLPPLSDTIFTNITTLGWTRAVVATLPEENYLTNNKSVFLLNMSVENTFDYDLIIKASHTCPQEKKVFLLILIPSVPEDFEKRKAIRRTWLGVGERDLWPRVTLGGITIRHVFLLGLRHNIDLKRLQVEADQHEDIVLAGFLDSYRNLTTKVLVGLQWAGRYCPQAELVLKVDQDTLINMPLMAGLLANVRQRARESSGAADFVLGLAHGRPVVRRQGKWAVAESSYPLAKFPLYMYGHTYAISAPGATSRLLGAARHVPLLAPEDAFITGVLAKTAGVTRLTSRAFTVCCRRLISRCEVVWNQRAAFTGLDTIALLDSMWADIASGQCDPKIHFKPVKVRNNTVLKTNHTR
ncbi:beta-1,3-galactosyltransferase 1-like [Elysia marginata]|uniref:Hexosyltransferase n=1 Tax=Elysia marginata TaxID=1093978 RepID=A0AAV4EWH6_9GAST|nr:beta-1,3-galactosyltransferase 1-like [Elysia marginata]